MSQPSTTPDSRSPAFRRAVIVLGTLGVLVGASIPSWIASRTPERNAAAGLLITGSRAPGRPARVGQITTSGPAQRAGLRNGDTLVAIQGIPITDKAKLKELSSRAQPGDTLRYEIRRKAGAVTIPIGLEAMPERGAVRSAMFVGVGAVFILIAAFVAWRMPFDPRALLFFGIGLATVTSLWTTPGVRIADMSRGIVPDEFFSSASLAAVIASSIAGMFFLTLLLHFALVFPRRAPLLAAHPRLTTWGYVFPLTCLATFCALIVVGFASWPVWVSGLAIGVSLITVGVGVWCIASGTGSWWRKIVAHPWAILATAAGLTGALGFAIQMIPREHALRRPLRVAYGLTASGGSAVGFGLFALAVPILVTVLLLKSYRAADLEERQQIRWPLWSIIISALGGVLISACFGLLGLLGWQPLKWVWLSDLLTLPLTLLIPVGFAVGILRYRLMDLDVVIRRTAIYGVVTAIMVVLYFGVVAGIGGWLAQTFAVKSQWVTVVGTLAVAAAFIPVRRRMQVEIDRRFYRTRYEPAEALRRLGERLSHGGDATTLARIGCEELHQTLVVRSAAILLREGETRKLLPAGALGLTDADQDKLEVRIDGDLESALAVSRIVPASALHGEAVTAIKAAHARLVVTIRRPSGIVGLILVGSRLSDSEFEDADRDYLESLANQLSMAVANLGSPARRRELEEARQIQIRLLPQVLPRVSGLEIAAHWQPAQEVAGDYYDVLLLGENRVGLCIADVTGKGMPAALLMSNLQASVKTFAGPEVTPQALCERINRVMADAVGPGRFVTLFFAVFDIERRELCYTNAGHNPPMVLRSGGEVEMLEIGGTLMGPFADARFAQGEITLAPGDRLVLYTDGVTEAMDRAGELFGEDRLRQVGIEAASGGALHVQRLVLERVTEFCEGVFQDDATILVVAVEEREGPSS
jgi:Stage II sporulation protein E (SpoIIE)/PDZ domain/GAF domain